MNVAIDITDTATPEVKAEVAGVQSVGIKEEMARAVVGMTKDHLYRLEQERPNKLGGKRTHFYSQVAGATNQQVLADGFELRIADGRIRQRWRGGRIPQSGDASPRLTIPVDAEAYGRRARSFNDLRLSFRRSHGQLLTVLEKAQATLLKKGKRGFKASGKQGGRVLYILKKSVNQLPDPSVLPNEDEWKAAAVHGAQNFINRRKRRA